MGVPRTPENNADTAEFVRYLYTAGGFVSWRQFADEAGVHPTQVSMFQTGAAEPKGRNLLALIRAVAAREGGDEASVALRYARAAFADLLARTAARQESLGEALDTVLANQEKAGEKLDALHRRLDELDARRPDGQAAPKR